RVANLPTVWADCLAGWWLGGGENYWKLPLLLAGVSLLYTGGMFLNDAFDEEYDRLRQPARPIPSGKISAGLVWGCGFGEILAGILLLLGCGSTAAASALALAFFIVVYDFTHKFFTVSPWLMGACRFWVYLIAGATGAEGLNGFVIFGGTVLALYVAGLSYAARREGPRGRLPRWPLPLLAAPIVLALMTNTGGFLMPAILVSILLALWIVRCIRSVFTGGEANATWIASNLLAGAVLVDWLAVAPQLRPWHSALVFLPLLGLVKGLQKIVPAT
ncbi:MAG: UbiA family prenyltransferase, partial [Verrucomicrobiae bacterium]|nr:UbiA family prenyltransferase [Verrucomicrobiae bacterium]